MSYLIAANTLLGHPSCYRGHLRQYLFRGNVFRLFTVVNWTISIILTFWRLITDLPVTCVDEAIEKSGWYALRWKRY